LSHTTQPTGDEQLITILEKQKQDLVVRFLQKHEEAESNRRFISRIMANLSDLLLVLSANMQIVQVCKEFHRTLEVAEKEELPSLADITTKENYQLIVDHIANGEFEALETALLSRNGKVIPVSLRGTTYVTESGRILHMLIASDRREFYEVMGRMREIQDQLIHSGRLASLGEMAAGIGHELTQPLNTILLLARNCLKALEQPQQQGMMLRDNLATIIDRVNHASTIIRSLRGFASKAKEELSPLRIKVILLDVLGFVETQLQLSGIDVTLELAEEDFLVLGLEVRLEQVLLNLIQNAIQAMATTAQPALLIATFRHSGIDPQNLQRRNYAAIAITDNGEGIKPDIRDKIFNPFFTTREVGTGMGLGLSIVERIVRGFSGYLTVDSEVGKGSTFTVFLPELDSNT
jgi:C4-dicarboxylate-specific signal transduction histidine kinase